MSTTNTAHIININLPQNASFSAPMLNFNKKADDKPTANTSFGIRTLSDRLHIDQASRMHGSDLEKEKTELDKEKKISNNSFSASALSSTKDDHSHLLESEQRRKALLLRNLENRKKARSAAIGDFGIGD